MKKHLRILSDNEIQMLIDDEKLISAQQIIGIHPIPKNSRQHTSYHLNITSVSKRKYSIQVRTNLANVFDFSIILSYYDEQSHKWYLLRRYNGSNHSHRNHIENTKISRNFHIHKATERYQKEGRDIVGYAESTNKYSNWKDALQLMFEECNFRSTDISLFDYKG